MYCYVGPTLLGGNFYYRKEARFVAADLPDLEGVWAVMLH